MCECCVTGSRPGRPARTKIPKRPGLLCRLSYRPQKQVIHQNNHGDGGEDGDSAALRAPSAGGTNRGRRAAYDFGFSQTGESFLK
jgi:hypothetical protein